MEGIEDISTNENQLHEYQGVKLLTGLLGFRNSKKSYKSNSDFETY